jgi:hypothetical protein
MIAIFVPYGTTIGTGVVKPMIMQWLDHRHEKDPNLRKYATKKSARALFKNLYSSGDYVIHFKYSGVLNIVYVAFMYGLGLPLLFPIAGLSIFSQWANERYNIAYVFKLPPTLDEKLT